MSTKEIPWGKVQLAHTADNCAILIVLFVKVRMAAEYPIPSLGLHNLLWESLCALFILHSLMNNDWGARWRSG